ncbi:hypothetical protein C2G38_2031228 [Gigaspora rosea]|uniref:SAP domain-containing protein n=1 Tax=Gigaspora rosea TaxID=44941 RepID=A0A397VTY9_9GLOM|nr:hypothetical protein C2G38_2031228 [Gigaspora rosea]
MNNSTPTVGWTKLTLAELKNLCVAFGVVSEGNKEELGERLHKYFEKKVGKLPEVSQGQSGGEPGQSNKEARGHPDKTGDGVFGAEEVVDLEEEDGDPAFQEADDGMKEELRRHFQGKEKIDSVPVDIF